MRDPTWVKNVLGYTTRGTGTPGPAPKTCFAGQQLVETGSLTIHSECEILASYVREKFGQNTPADKRNLLIANSVPGAVMTVSRAAVAGAGKRKTRTNIYIYVYQSLGEIEAQVREKSWPCASGTFVSLRRLGTGAGKVWAKF